MTHQTSFSQAEFADKKKITRREKCPELRTLRPPLLGLTATRRWHEEASRPRKQASGGQVRALLRGAILRLHDAEAFESLNAGFHHHRAKPYTGLPETESLILDTTLQTVAYIT